MTTTLAGSQVYYFKKEKNPDVFQLNEDWWLDSKNMQEIPNNQIRSGEQVAGRTEKLGVYL